MHNEEKVTITKSQYFALVADLMVIFSDRAIGGFTRGVPHDIASLFVVGDAFKIWDRLHEKNGT